MAHTYCGRCGSTLDTNGSCPNCDNCIYETPKERQIFLCPNCNGQKIVSKPPDIAGDQETWFNNSIKTYPCPTCNGKGYIIDE